MHFALFKVGAGTEMILLMSHVAKFCYLTNRKRLTPGEFEEIKRLLQVSKIKCRLLFQLPICYPQLVMKEQRLIYYCILPIILKGLACHLIMMLSALKA